MIGHEGLRFKCRYCLAEYLRSEQSDDCEDEHRGTQDEFYEAYEKKQLEKARLEKSQKKLFQ